MSGGGLADDWQFHNISAGNRVTNKFALDNGCFSKGFDKVKFDKYLKRVEDRRHLCLFIVMPDKMCDPVETLRLWNEHYADYSDWPLAYVAQDGQENIPFPDEEQYSCLFIGGSTEWKMSEGAKECVHHAVRLGKHVHIGRVNSYKRFKHFASMDGGDLFTCDGTKQRFEGREKANETYRSYQDKYADSIRGGLFTGDSRS
jgi:hypothetical protein